MSTNLLKLSLSIICCIFIANGFAQQTYQQADIIKKIWEGESYYSIFCKYTNTKAIFRYEGKTYTRQYYLSDAIDTAFDKSKVGNSSSGRYIIVKRKKNDSISYIEEILMLTDNTLILRATPWKALIGGSGIQVYYTQDLYKNNRNIVEQTFQLSDIAGKKWKQDSIIIDDTRGYNFFIEYKNNERCINYNIDYIEKGRKEEIVEYEYYLSDNIDSFRVERSDGSIYIMERDSIGCFDLSKVGEISSGRYIIGRDSEGFLYIYKILKLTYDRLILRHINGLYGSSIIPFHLVE